MDITSQLITYLKCPDDAKDTAIITGYVNALLACGKASDANFLLDHFLTHPVDNFTSGLLPLFAQWGDASVARKIFDAHVTDKPQVVENYPDLLETLGKLHFEPVKPLLIKHAFESDDHYLNKFAVLGLLHFNCDEIADRIKHEIEKTYGKNLFPEFTPALVCKLKNRSEILEKLWESGKEYCSTDCNAGIILGFSLCGEEGRPYFKKVLYDDRWEADASSTGTARFTYRGTINQQLSLLDFFKELTALNNEEKQRQGLWVLMAMLKLRINDYTSSAIDTITDLYAWLFAWHCEPDIMTLARSYALDEQAYRLRDLMEIKLNEALILRGYKDR